MSSSPPQRSTSVLKDWIQLQTVQYLLLITNERLELLRCIGSKRLESVFGSHLEEGDQGLEGSLNRLGRSSSYYGQSLLVLIHNDHSFGYARRLDTSQTPDPLKKLRTMNDDSVCFTTRILKHKSKRYVIAQGVAQSYLDQLDSWLSQAGIAATGVAVLGSYLISKNLDRVEASGRLGIHLPGLSCALLSGDDGSIVFREVTLDPDDDLMRLVFRLDPPEPLEYGLGGKPSASLLLADALFAPPSSRPHAWRISSSRVATVLQTAANSLKLFVGILLLVTLFSLTVAVIMTITSSGEDLHTSDYQKKYTEKMELENTQDSLRAVISSMPESARLIESPAAVISALCQTRPRGLYLSRVDLVFASHDSLVVEARGRSRSERTVFSYHRSLEKYISPHRLKLGSLAPESIHEHGTMDTAISFNLSTEIYGY